MAKGRRSMTSLKISSLNKIHIFIWRRLVNVFLLDSLKRASNSCSSFRKALDYKTYDTGSEAPKKRVDHYSHKTEQNSVVNK